MVILDGGVFAHRLSPPSCPCLDNHKGRALMRPDSSRDRSLGAGVGSPYGRWNDSPGSGRSGSAAMRHRQQLEIVDSDDLEGSRRGEKSWRGRKEEVGGCSPCGRHCKPPHMTWINAGKKPGTCARNLYNHLRTLDRVGCVRIFVQSLGPLRHSGGRRDSPIACSAPAAWGDILLGG